jgi:hypothetical protein
LLSYSADDPPTPYSSAVLDIQVGEIAVVDSAEDPEAIQEMANLGILEKLNGKLPERAATYFAFCADAENSISAESSYMGRRIDDYSRYVLTGGTDFKLVPKLSGKAGWSFDTSSVGEDLEDAGVFGDMGEKREISLEYAGEVPQGKAQIIKFWVSYSVFGCYGENGAARGMYWIPNGMAICVAEYGES